MDAKDTLVYNDCNSLKTTDTSAGFQNVASTNHFRIELVEKSVIQKVNMKRTSILRKIIISFFSKLLK